MRDHDQTNNLIIYLIFMLQNSALLGSQLFQEASLVYSHTATIDVNPGTSFIVKGNILKNCERYFD